MTEKSFHDGKWDAYYGSLVGGTPDHDDWLSPYGDLRPYPGAGRAVDLGCGEGYAGEFLLGRGFQVVFCDLSPEALGLVKKRIPEAVTRRLDLREPLPFGPRYAQVVVADLSLHYFDRKTTEAVADEIARVLVPGGLFLCRVNASDDVLHGAGRGTMLEPGFYLHEGNFKRFFTREDLEALFSTRFEMLSLEHKSILRKGTEKRLWEAALKAQPD